MNALSRKISKLETELGAGVDNDVDDLFDCLPADLRHDLLRAVWLFAKDAGITPSDLDFSLDALPDTKAARECQAKYEAAVIKWWEKARAPEKLRLNHQFGEAVRQWLSDNPRAQTILNMYRRDYKRPNRLDRTARDQPAKTGDPQERIQAVKDALMTLDPNNDAHWTSKGLPQTVVVAWLSGVLTLTHAELNEAAPDFNRQAARMRVNERF